MKISENIKIIRKENNLSQEQLAEQLGVSRQAVSKWESGQSYPEMDKVLLICNLYNYNIDELMNENVKEVAETKESKTNLNKYVEDFFNYITKTVDMFSSMTFKQKIKCLFEQVLVAIFIVSVLAIIGGIFILITEGLTGILPHTIYYAVRQFLNSIYILLAVVIGIIVFLHIFKSRYLDYYEIIKEKEIKENNEEELSSSESSDNKKQTVFLENKKTKIIIRDPEHTQSKFLTGIMKAIIWFIKLIFIFIEIGFCFSFIGLVTLFVLSFMFVKTGITFFGGILAIISALIINFVILNINYNIIISKKCHKNILAILLIMALILAGCGIGMILSSIPNFNIIETLEENQIIKDEYTVSMEDTLSIMRFGNVEFIEVEASDVKIEVEHSKYFKSSLSNENNEIFIYIYQDDTETMELVREFIKGINDKKIIMFNNTPKIKVYASKDNIEKIKLNWQEQLRKMQELDSLNNKIEEQYNEIENLQEKIVELEMNLEEKNIELQDKENEMQMILQENVNN